MVKNSISSRALYKARHHGYFSLQCSLCHKQVLTGQFHYPAFSFIHLFFFSWQNTLPHQFWAPNPAKVNHRTLASPQWLVQGRHRTQAEAIRDPLQWDHWRRFSSSRLGQGCVPKAASHLIPYNRKKPKKIKTGTSHAPGQRAGPQAARCPDAVSYRPTHQSSKPLSSLSWPSTTRY